MSIRQGNNVISGSKKKELGLFTPQWYDYVLEDINWIRADTFSWHNGTIYTAAYQHLLSDIDGKTLQSETVEGTTVFFYLADDGHKIAERNQETAIRTIYENTGIAWYYIIDTNSNLFKLPRARFDIYGGSSAPQAQTSNMCLYFFIGNFAQSTIENNPTSPITGETNWGQIGGTLSDQTDLQLELDGKVNKSGDVIKGTTTIFANSSGAYSQVPVLKLGAKLENQEEPTNYISINASPSSSSLYVNHNIYAGDINPATGGGKSLGHAGFAWNSIYVNSIKSWENNEIKTIDIPKANGTMALTGDIGDATLTIQKNGTAIDTFTANATTDKTINITVPTQASDVNALPDTTKYAASASLTIDSTTYIATLQLKDQDGNNLGSAQTIDLPLESVVVSGSYDSTNKKIVLTLQNGSTIDISVGDLISGLQTEITAQNMLSADYVDDSTTTHKFVTASDKATWSGKQDAISDLSTIRSNASAGKAASDTIANYGDVVSHSASDFATSTQGGKADTAVQPGDNVSTLTNDAGYLTQHQSLSDLGVTATAAELNVLDGITASTTELNYVDGVTSAIQTQIDGKQATIPDLSTIRNGASAGATALQPGDNVSNLINDAGYLTSVDSEIEWATYGTTTYQQVKDWVTAGKLVLVNNSGKIYKLENIRNNDCTFKCFSGVNSTQSNAFINCLQLTNPSTWYSYIEYYQLQLPSGTAGDVLTYTGTAGSVGSTTLAAVATSGNSSDLNNDAGFITQDINVNALGIEYAISSSDQQVSSVTTWTKQTSPLSDRQRAVCYGNGYWVTAGANGSLAYSTNGTTWTAITPFCTGTITGITYGNGYFLAVEYESKKVWKSNTPDGTWTNIYTATDSIESIQYINNTFILTGENGLIAQSETGAVWNAKTTGVSTSIYKAAYGNGMYVAVGASGTILTSINGDVWTSRTSGTANDIRTVAYGDGKFVCGGKEVLYSSDGITWTQAATIPETISGWMREFAYGEKRFYCAVYTSGGYGQIWYSTDCNTWTKALDIISESNTRLWDMVFGNNVFISSGDLGQIYTLDLNVSWVEDRPAISSGDYLWYRNVIIQNNGSKIYSDAYYVSAGADALPSQTGNAGKFLTTDGSSASWGEALVNKAEYFTTTSVAIGPTTGVNGAREYSVNIGYNSFGTSSNAGGSVGIGANAKTGGLRSIAIGYGTETDYNAPYAIQIGSLTGNTVAKNNDANTLKIANGVANYELMSADGTIPEDRLADTTNATSGQALTLDSNKNAVWSTIDSLPSQSGQSGKYLTTDGTSASWATVSTTLSGLTDVTISSPVADQVLSYNGTSWGNTTPPPVMVITDYTA